MELRDRVAARREFRDVKVSPLLFVAKAVMLAAARTPEINATWDDAAGEIVLKHYVNLGIAAATERGLIVPNIKDADRLSLLELALAIAALTDTARAGPHDPGGHGRRHVHDHQRRRLRRRHRHADPQPRRVGHPRLRRGAADAVGRRRRTRDERIEPRWVTQLAVSFDHRIVDGQQGSQFLADVGAVLTDPGMALL